MIFKTIALVFVSCELMLSNIHCNTPSDPATFNAHEDAIAIFKDRNQAYIDILLNRDVKQCEQINLEFAKLNNGFPIITERYIPLPKHELENLLFALIKGTQRTKISYIQFQLTAITKDSQRVLMELLVFDDKNKRNLISDYNYNFVRPLADTVKTFQDDDYKNFLVEMISRTREDKYNGPSQEEADAAKLLDEERKKDGSWGDNREQLDTVLIQKPREFVLEVIKKYAENNHGNQLRDDIGKKIENKNMKFGYQSLIDYLVDPIKYMATRLHDCKDEDDDYDATFILVIVCFSENGLKDVNEVFQKEYKKSIKDFLLENNPNITRRILAAIVEKKLQVGAPTAAPPPPSPAPAPAP